MLILLEELPTALSNHLLRQEVETYCTLTSNVEGTSTLFPGGKWHLLISTRLPFLRMLSWYQKALTVSELLACSWLLSNKYSS